jgi:thymidine kinase
MAKLYFRYSAMNAGKSTELLQVAHNYEENGRKAFLYTAQVDDRYGVGKVTSRLGPQREAKTFNEDLDFFNELQQLEEEGCVLIDEAQFLSPRQVQELHRAANFLDIPVICFGLRSDFKGNPFPGAAYLMCLADSIEERKTICACGKRASMNMRVNEQGHKVTDGAQVEVGGNSRYRPVCARCYYSATEVPGQADSSPAFKSFIQRCLDKESCPAQIDDFVNDWHQGKVDGSLRQALGLTEPEYAAWVLNANSFNHALAARLNSAAMQP